MAHPTETPQILNFISVNESQSRSIVFAHGAFSSHHEWSLVSAYLPNFHLLIPDLPGHGHGSSASIPFSLSSSVSQLANLITMHAHDGRADVVGLSFGGYAVISLASKHPGLVRSVFASGCHLNWQGKWKNRFMGLGLGLDTGISSTVPKSWYLWANSRMGLSVSDALYEDKSTAPWARNGSYGAGRKVAQELATFEVETWENVKARTLLVVGSKEPYPNEAGKLGDPLRTGNGDSKVVIVEGMVHPWSLQAPELFARGVIAWIEGKNLPEEFLVQKSET